MFHWMHYWAQDFEMLREYRWNEQGVWECAGLQSFTHVHCLDGDVRTYYVSELLRRHNEYWDDA